MKNISDYKSEMFKNIFPSDMPVYVIDQKNDGLRDISFFDLNRNGKISIFKFSYMSIAPNMTVTISNSTLQGFFNLERNSTLILENCFVNSPIENKLNGKEQPAIFMGTECSIFITESTLKVYTGSKVLSTFLLNNSKLNCSKNTKIYSFYNEINGSDITFENVIFNPRDFFDYKLDSSYFIKPLFDLSYTSAKISNCLFNGVVIFKKSKNSQKNQDFDIVQKCLFIRKASKINVSQCDFYNYKLSILASQEKSEFHAISCRFNDNFSDIFLNDQAKAKLTDCIFENSIQDSHVFLRSGAFLHATACVFSQSKKAQIYASNLCELVLIKCSFFDTQHTHIEACFDCRLEIFNSYFTNAQSTAIFLQGSLPSRIITSTIENCKNGIVISDLSYLFLESSTLRGLNDYGLVVSTGSNVEGNGVYFFGGKILAQQSSSLLFDSSFFTKDQRKEKSIDQILEDTCKIHYNINTISKINDVSSIVSNNFEIKTQRPIFLTRCLIGEDFLFSYRNQADFTFLMELESIGFKLITESLPEKCMKCHKTDKLLFNSCGHFTFCDSCSKTMNYCPICMQQNLSVSQNTLNVKTAQCELCQSPTLQSKERFFFIFPGFKIYCTKCINKLIKDKNSPLYQQEYRCYYIVPYS